MNRGIQKIYNELIRLEIELQKLRQEVVRLERQAEMQWQTPDSNPVYQLYKDVFIYHKAYFDGMIYTLELLGVMANGNSENEIE